MSITEHRQEQIMRTLMPNNVRSAQAAKSQPGRDVKSTWKTIARGGGAQHFRLGNQEESQIKCGLCAEYLMLATYMCTCVISMGVRFGVG